MLFIISLIIVALFIYFLKDSLKKYANIFYIGAAVISIAVFLLANAFVCKEQYIRNICKRLSWNGNVCCGNVHWRTA